jgi:hypothetical protein
MLRDTKKLDALPHWIFLAVSPLYILVHATPRAFFFGSSVVVCSFDTEWTYRALKSNYYFVANCCSDLLLLFESQPQRYTYEALEWEKLSRKESEKKKISNGKVTWFIRLSLLSLYEGNQKNKIFHGCNRHLQNAIRKAFCQQLDATCRLKNCMICNS